MNEAHNTTGSRLLDRLVFHGIQLRKEIASRLHVLIRLLCCNADFWRFRLFRHLLFERFLSLDWRFRLSDRFFHFNCRHLYIFAVVINGGLDNFVEIRAVAVRTLILFLELEKVLHPQLLRRQFSESVEF